MLFWLIVPEIESIMARACGRFGDRDRKRSDHLFKFEHKAKSKQKVG